MRRRQIRVDLVVRLPADLVGPLQVARRWEVQVSDRRLIKVALVVRLRSNKDFHNNNNR